jgi:hypothetical protein
VGQERSPLSLVSTIEELLERESSRSALQNRDYGRRGFVTLTIWYRISELVDTKFVDKLRSLGLYSSLTDSAHGL